MCLKSDTLLIKLRASPLKESGVYISAKLTGLKRVILRTNSFFVPNKRNSPLVKKWHVGQAALQKWDRGKLLSAGNTCDHLV